MKTKILDNIDCLVDRAMYILRHEFRRREGCVKFYRLFWHWLKMYMCENDLQVYDEEIGRKFLTHKLGERDHDSLTNHQKKLVRSVRMLNELLTRGEIVPKGRVVKFEGELGDTICRFINHKRMNRMSAHRLRALTLYLHNFYKYLTDNDIVGINQIDQIIILQFIKSMDSYPNSVAYSTVGILKDMFNYLYEQQVLNINYSRIIPRGKYVKQANLPSTYSVDEVTSLISVVNRSSPNGKRDYAIILLAARVGLRSSDICNMKFDNLNWDSSLIELTQQKTRKKIILPLLPDVGNAIIDYLKYGRPESNEPFVFILGRSPYTRMYTHSVHVIVSSNFRKAGVDITNRKHGGHSLRHSLSRNMLEKNTMLPVISEVLGHEYTSSTKYYLRIDLNSLRKCALDVPNIENGFYQQKGGLFYE